MTTIYGPSGKPFSEKQLQEYGAGNKDQAPVIGESFGPWAGRDLQFINLPGGGVVQFDLSKLSVADFRMMTSHYQVNSSLSVLTFMLHQLEWHIEADDPKVVAHVEQNMADIWTRLVRAMSQAFWAGYSPNILQWENVGNSVQLTKIKDLVPEDAKIKWDTIDGTVPPGYPNATPPKINVYGGIIQRGSKFPVPVANSLWYPLLMENGDYSGRKLLKSAFTPWFFSTLIHLFSNRYFERFGEPVPIGRAPLDETVTHQGSKMSSTDYMGQIINSIRSRASVVLPSDRVPNSTGDATKQYEYDIEYLESQMRGADFERYMTRLDEEISLALFTPLLLMRTADVGSYNLGTSHMQMYLWQLNAIAGDWAEYINKYIIKPMAKINFGENAAVPKIVFRKLGKQDGETMKAVLVQLIKTGAAGVDLVELGQATGLTVTEAEALVKPEVEVEPVDDEVEEEQTHGKFSAPPTQANGGVVDKIVARVAAQAARAHAKGRLDAGWEPDMGFASYFPQSKFDAMKIWHADVMTPGAFADDAEYMSAFTQAAIGLLGSVEEVDNV